MGVLRRLVLGGRMYDVCCVVSDTGRCNVESFLKKDLRSDPTAAKKAMALLQEIANNGIDDLDRTKYEVVRGGVSELKVQAVGLRFFGFVDTYRGKILVLERGWKKGPKKEQDRQIDAVIRFKEDYNPDEWPIEEPK